MDTNRRYWFAGAKWDEGDQTERFLAEGIWQNGFTDRLLDQVRSMRPGERIAIKAAYIRRKDLPFDNRGHTVSTMSIKAIGIITENLGDGRTVRVDWQRRFEPPREWYFFTYQPTLWQIELDSERPDAWMRENLVAFAFDGQEQQLERFVNHPFWRERFGTMGATQRFQWTAFYEALADRLLAFRANRAPLVAGLHEIAARQAAPPNLTDRLPDGTSTPLQDIDPFTVYGLFNRKILESSRTQFAADLAEFLGLDLPAPTAFDGLPRVDNRNVWFFSYADKRAADDIEDLWTVFAEALRLARGDEASDSAAFAAAYDRALSTRGVKWNLTTGLYWVRPWDYPTLDGPSRDYIKERLGLPVGGGRDDPPPNGQAYIELKERLEQAFNHPDCPVHSFPELSQASWGGANPPPVTIGKGPVSPPPEAAAYSIDQIIGEGCFIPRDRLEQLLATLRGKQNLILQGPPGTGKTWLARRLAYALIGQQAPERVRALQFHPNMSYEDFVRGWRPGDTGRLQLVDGPFLQAVSSARADPALPYVVVLEEVNRGNPAQIFGEMLTLLEADKRRPEDALELSYPRPEARTVYLPPNLYVIGTMNIADRSLAIVDFALRRRFAFADLAPELNGAWLAWVTARGLTQQQARSIQDLLARLNEQIAGDHELGPQFRLGHSFVTPAADARITDGPAWFRGIVEAEIGPLLEEYWFDDQDKARRARQQLLDGLL
jgi:5-methylcytosine-specific restriction enzyme B